MKRILTSFIAVVLLSAVPNYAWSQDKSITPTVQETIQQLKAIKESKFNKAAWSGVFALASGTGGLAFLLSSKTIAVDRAEKAAEYRAIITKKDAVIKMLRGQYNMAVQGTGKSTKAPLILYDQDNIKIELDKTPSTSDGTLVLSNGRFKVSAPNMKEVAFTATSDQVKAFEQVTTTTEYELSQMLKKVKIQKVAGGAFIAIAGVSLIYSVYNIFSAIDVQTTQTAVNEQSIQTLLAHDYSKPLPPNLVMLLSDDKLRDSIYTMDIIREELEKKLL